MRLGTCNHVGLPHDWLQEAHSFHAGRLLLFGSNQPRAFCAVCGFFAEQNIKSLKLSCGAPVSALSDPSRHYRLAKMSEGRHPLQKCWATCTRRFAFGSIVSQAVAPPGCSPLPAARGASPPRLAACAEASLLPVAPIVRLGLPVVSGTGIPKLDELLALKQEAGFAEAEALAIWPEVDDGMLEDL